MSDTGDAGERRADGIPAGELPDGLSDHDLAAMQVPTRRIILIGMVMWTVALAVILAVPSLHEGDRSWWPWACVAGLVLGGLGYLYVRRGRGNAHDAG